MAGAHLKVIALPGADWCPQDDETIELMANALGFIFKIADIHNKSVQEVLEHMEIRWDQVLTEGLR